MSMKKSQNGSRLEETTAQLQQAMATLLQVQAQYAAQAQATNERMERKFAEIDQRFDQIEALLRQLFAELPQKMFGFAQAAKKEPS
jgi:hypothetical protein